MDKVRAFVGALVLALVALAASCSNGDDGTDGASDADDAPASTTVAEGGATTTTQPTSDELTPLIVTTLNEPIPVKGADGRYHVAYELHVLNASTRAARITEVETITVDGEPLQSISGEEVVARTVPIGPLPADPPPAEELASGTAAVLAIDDTYDSLDEIPDRFSHVITATFGPVPEGSHPFAEMYPEQVEERTGEVRLGDGEPLVIGSPLRGTDWLAANSCCLVTPHRGSILPMAGRINATERFAIDFVRIAPELLDDPSANPLGGGLPTAVGDPTTQEAYRAYDQELLAVADGTVVKVVDGYPDATPQELPTGLSVEDLPGNYLILDLGDGFYAFYAHVKEASFEVQEGDRVTKGQVVGRLGNTGNSTEAHLHFHISRGPTPLAADQWPYVFESFDVQGTIDPATGELVREPEPGPRRDELPLTFNLVDFPD